VNIIRMHLPVISVCCNLPDIWNSARKNYD
jgi:hypothetical protein